MVKHKFYSLCVRNSTQCLTITRVGQKRFSHHEFSNIKIVINANQFTLYGFSCQSLLAMSSLKVNDILEELLDENNRILNQLLFAHRVIIKSLQFKVFIDSIAKEFVHQLKPEIKEKYEELSLGLNLLIHQKCANISGDESPNESKTVNVIKSVTSDQSIETDSDYHTINDASDEEEYISEEESAKELDGSKASEKKNNKPKHICDQCGSSYDFQEVFELHILYCRPESQSVSTESQPEYNCSDIEEEEGEKEMVSGELVTENTVTLDKCYNYEVSDNEESLAEEHLVEESVTDKLSVRTENFSHKPMTRSRTKAVSGQQSSDFNLSSKPNTKQKSKPNSRTKKKIFSFKCGFNRSNFAFRERKAMIFSTKFHHWKCNFPGCDFQNKYKSMVKSHLIRHSNDRPFECQHCYKKYKHDKGLRHHMKTRHLDQCPNDPILVCDWNECQYTTKSLTALNLHKRIHTLPFECYICKRRFSTKNNMKTHSISKHKIKIII